MKTSKGIISDYQGYSQYQKSAFWNGVLAGAFIVGLLFIAAYVYFERQPKG